LHWSDYRGIAENQSRVVQLAPAALLVELKSHDQSESKQSGGMPATLLVELKSHDQSESKQGGDISKQRLEPMSPSFLKCSHQRQQHSAWVCAFRRS